MKANTHAVIMTGGKQYRVYGGQRIKLEKLPGQPGSSVVFDQVLMISDGDNNIQLGAPCLKGAQVVAEVLDQNRHKKIRVFKFKRRKGYKRTQGHRQDYTEVLIKEIKA
jgi:large subunit ribosomal protein L21